MHTGTRIHAYVQAYTYARIYTYTRIHICTHTIHTHIYTYIHSDEKTDDSGFFFNFPRHVAKANGVRGMEVSDDEYEYYDDDSYGDASAAAGVRAGEGEGEGAGEGAGEGEGEAALKVEVKDIYTMMGLTPPSSEDTQQKQTGGEEREENDRRQGGRRRRRGNSNSKSKSDDNAGGGGGGGDADREDPLAESHMARDNMLKVTLGESVKAETIIAGCFYDPEGDMSDEWKDLSARYEHAKQTADAYYTNAKSHIGDTLSDTYQKIKPYLPAPGMGGGAGADSGGGVGTGEGELAGEEEGADGAGGEGA